MVDIAPTDPIEGILVGQLMAANEAALSMYRRGWAQPSEYFSAWTKYLHLADKAARTVMMLTERLDDHRGRGQQQITVKHVTTNTSRNIRRLLPTVSHRAAPLASRVSGSPGREVPGPCRSSTRYLPDPVGVGGGSKSK